MNSNDRRKQKVMALTLAMTLLMGCNNNKGKNDCFELVRDENNEFVAVDGSYISNEYIDDYYVLEICNKLTNDNSIYIVNVGGNGVGNGYYMDVFTNLKFFVGFKDSVFDYVSITELSKYLFLFGLCEEKYSYDDMKNIYEVIKENYVFDEDDSLSKRRVIDNRM